MVGSGRNRTSTKWRVPQSLNLAFYQLANPRVLGLEHFLHRYIRAKILRFPDFSECALSDFLFKLNVRKRD